MSDKSDRPDPGVVTYDEFMAELRRRKRERWVRILLSEPPGRPAGRRPRDPEQERLLAELDRRRLRRRVTDDDA